MLSDIADTELSEIARAPVKTLPTTSEGTTLRSGNFPAPLFSETAIETTSDMDFAAPLVTTSEIVDPRSSDVVLNPVKTLPTTSEGTTLRSGNFPAPLFSETAIETTSDMDFAAPLVTTSEIVDPRSSDVVLNPVKALPTTSEGTTLRSGNFPAPLLSETAIETTSDMDFAAPLVTTSEIVDPRSSDVVLNPVKTLPTTSEGTTLRSGNFPAPLFSETAIETTSDMDFAAPLVTTSEIADERSSDVVLNPVKTLPTTSEGTTLNSGNFPAPLFSETAIETTSDMDFAAPLVTTSEIADERSHDVVLNPVKTLDAASEMVGVSASVLNPVKTLPMTSEGTTLSSGNFPAPLLTEAAIAEARLTDVLRNPVNALVTLSDIEDTELSEIARAPVNTLPTTS